MGDVDREFLRKLADWSADGAPVSSLYLDVDGRRYPRKQDLLTRVQSSTQQLQRRAQDKGLSKDALSSVKQDAQRMHDHVEGLERGLTRGVAMFSSAAAGLWEAVEVPRPVPDWTAVAEHPFVAPLEALIETYQSFCTALVDREKARIFLARMGRIEERTDILDDVPGRHEQGGWSQARYQRHVDEHALAHLKHVAEELLRFWKVRKFDHLILAGASEAVAEFEHHLHSYLSQLIADRVSLPMTVSEGDVLARSLEVEERIEAQREAAMVDRVHAEAAAGRHGVEGLEPVLAALSDDRVETLVVPLGASGEGVRCSVCGWLGVAGKACTRCGGETEPLLDVVEAAVALAVRHGARVEVLTLLAEDQERQRPDVGALLRF